MILVLSLQVPKLRYLFLTDNFGKQYSIYKNIQKFDTSWFRTPALGLVGIERYRVFASGSQFRLPGSQATLVCQEQALLETFCVRR